MSGEPRLPRGPLLELLEVLVGRWVMRAMSSGSVVAQAIVTMDWIEDAFLLQRVEADPSPDAPDEWGDASPFPTVTIIGLDDLSGTFSCAYADGRGVHRTYAMEFDGTTWEITGRAGPSFHQRSTATVAADGTSIEGRWERSVDGTAWELDFDVAYEKVGPSPSVMST